MLSNEKGTLKKEYISDYVVFDLETTGISCQTDEVIEISAIRVRDGKVVDEFSSLVNPGREIPYFASKVNGITDQMVCNAPYFEEVLASFIEFIGEDTLVGHNIHSFDIKFIYRDCGRYFGKLPNNDYVDSLLLAKKCLPHLKHRKLVDLAQYYGISSEGAHRALNDCYMNYRIFEKMGRGEESSKTVQKTNTNASEKAVQKMNINVAEKTVRKTVQKKVETSSAEEILFGTSKIRVSTGPEEDNKYPRCGLSLILRSGRYGNFYGCTGFPDCRYTRN